MTTMALVQVMEEWNRDTDEFWINRTQYLKIGSVLLMNYALMIGCYYD